jgi:hypothetical protein
MPALQPTTSCRTPIQVSTSDIHADVRDTFSKVSLLLTSIFLAMQMYYLETRSRGISYMKYINGRLTGLVTFCVETAFYSRLLKER